MQSNTLPNETSMATIISYIFQLKIQEEFHSLLKNAFDDFMAFDLTSLSESDRKQCLLWLHEAMNSEHDWLVSKQASLLIKFKSLLDSFCPQLYSIIPSITNEEYLESLATILKYNLHTASAAVDTILFSDLLSLDMTEQGENEAETLQEIKNTSFDLERTQAALTFVLRHFSDVYVLSLAELIDKTQLSVNKLRARGFHYAAFPVLVDSNHQVGVWASLYREGAIIEIYDSLGDACHQKNIEKVSSFFDKIIDAKHSSSIFNMTPDYCALQLLGNLEVRCIKLKLYAEAAQAFQVDQTTAKPQLKMKCNLDILLKKYYRASEQQRRLMQPIEAAIREHDRLKRILLEFIEDNLPNYPDLLSLANFLQVKLWGNIDRCNKTSRPNQQKETDRVQTIPELYDEYRQTFSCDSLGKRLLLTARLQLTNKNKSEAELAKNFQRQLAASSSTYKLAKLNIAKIGSRNELANILKNIARPNKRLKIAYLYVMRNRIAPFQVEDAQEIITLFPRYTNYHATIENELAKQFVVFETNAWRKVAEVYGKESIKHILQGKGVHY